MEALLSVKEFAGRLRVSHWTVHSWLSKGLIVRVKAGSRTLIPESELEKIVRYGAKSPSPRNKRDDQS